MAGETSKAEAICLDIRPWSQTSHVVTWLTRGGRVSTLVKGAVRPQSAFLGQYDLNYTCEIVFYSRSRADLHALRECSPLEIREGMRGDYRAIAVAGYFRSLVHDFAPTGPDCGAWYDALSAALDGMSADPGGAATVGGVVRFELAVLGLLIGQIVGRWGNFTNREAHGVDTTVPWRMGLVYSYKTFYYHPPFLYESLWNILGFLLPQVLASWVDRSERLTVYHCQWGLLIVQTVLVFLL